MIIIKMFVMMLITFLIVLFQNKFSQSRYEVSVILPAFLLGRVDLRIVSDDAPKIEKPRAKQTLIV